MGNLPVLWIFAAISIGYAVACAVRGSERGSKVYPIHVGIAVVATVITALRILFREQIIVFLLGLIFCDAATFHFDYIGRKDDGGT